MSTHLSNEEKLYIYAILRKNKLIGQIWPVYSWDNGPNAYGLTISDDAAYELILEVADFPFSKKQFQGVLKHYGVAGLPSFSGKEAVQDALIADFYAKRRDRKIRPPCSQGRFEHRQKVPVGTLVATDTF